MLIVHFPVSVSLSISKSTVLVQWSSVVVTPSYWTDLDHS